LAPESRKPFLNELIALLATRPRSASAARPLWRSTASPPPSPLRRSTGKCADRSRRKRRRAASIRNDPGDRRRKRPGLLQLSIETQLHPALDHSWINTSEQPLEQQLPAIAAVFVAAAPLLKERRRRYEQAERRRREEEMRRYEEQRRRHWRVTACAASSTLPRAGRRRRRRGYSSTHWRRARPMISLKSSVIGPSINGSPGRAIALPRTTHLTTGPATVFQAIAAIDHWTYREVRDHWSI
jgi:hypothetical protein